MSHYNCLISENIDQILSQEKIGAREFPEIFAFFDYVKHLEKLSILKFNLEDKNTNNIFIPASNGGSIAALAILFSLSKSHNCFVRIPSNGLGQEMEIILRVLKRINLFNKKIFIISNIEFTSLIQSKKAFQKIFAWGANETKSKIEAITKNLSAELIYFGSQIGLSIIDLNEFFGEKQVKQRRILDNFTSDILTFDQGGCTNTKFVIFLSKDSKKTKIFLDHVNSIARKSRFESTISLQEKCGLLINASDFLNQLYTTKMFSLADRIWFFRLNQSYPNLFSNLDQFKGGIVGFNEITSLNQLETNLSQLPNFGRITFSSSNIKDYMSNLKIFDRACHAKFLNIGSTNTLNYFWDGIDLSAVGE